MGQGGRATRLALPVSGGWPVVVMERLLGCVCALRTGLHARVCSGWWGGGAQPRGCGVAWEIARR
eukprot:9778724-Alexandrium_andersonii.AAC.1